MQQFNIALMFQSKKTVAPPCVIMCCFWVPENISKEQLVATFQKFFIHSMASNCHRVQDALSSALMAVNETIGSGATSLMLEADVFASFNFN